MTNPDPNTQPSNKRKATEPPPHAPRAAPSHVGPQFFPKKFASPDTMPKRTGASPHLDYLASPTPSRTVELAPLLVLERPLQIPTQAPPAPLETPEPLDNMDILDSMETPKGLDASMHAPMAIVPQEDDDATFLEALAAVTESNSGAAAVSARLPSLLFTPLPPGGFPPTHRSLPAEFLVNLHPDTMKAWRILPQPKFFVRFFDYDRKDGTSKHLGLVAKLQKSLEIIASHVGAPKAKPKISLPSAPAVTGAAWPTTFLVYKTSLELCNAVLSQRVWSVPQVTFEAYPFESNIIPSIILCLAGYICPDEDTVVVSVSAAWVQSPALNELAEILMKYDPVFSGMGALLRARNAIQSMAASVRSEPLDFKTPGGNPSPRWNIYVTSPTSHIFAWSKIQAHVFKMTYPSILSGTATTRQLFSCAICHSFNHPQGLCPFPDIPGWNGPQHLDHLNDSSMRERGRGRGRS